MDSEMEKLMASTDPKKYITKQIVMSRRSPESWTMGFVGKNVTFIPVDARDGWLAISSNKWIPASACELISAVPPPDDDPVDPPAQGEFIGAELIRADGTRIEFIPKV